MGEASVSVPIRRWQEGRAGAAADVVAVEEPLQLLLDGTPLSVLMRTPGHDLELALGLLFAERVIESGADVVGVRLSAEAAVGREPLPVRNDLLEPNSVDVALAGGGRRPERSLLATSACGVCGARTIETLAVDCAPLPGGFRLDPDVAASLPERLRASQDLFATTGGLHAAGLFDAEGRLLFAREDVGRHNAVDKVVGRALLAGLLPARESILAVSGRLGYELVQKSVAAGIPCLVGVGAASSLAVMTAGRFNLTLVGFLRGRRFNVYSGAERLRL